MPTQARIGLIIPSSNTLTEPQFQKYTPPEIGVHVTRLRMTGKWTKPLSQLKRMIVEAAGLLGDTRAAIILFHCTATSMEAGLAGEANLVEDIQQAGGCPALTTGQAVVEALKQSGVKKIVLISPYVKKTNEIEVLYLNEAGFEVIHEFGLGLSGGSQYTSITPEQWKHITLENARDAAEGYFLSCTNTAMIETIVECESRLNRPVITSNQAALWACFKRLALDRPIKGPGRLFSYS